MNVPLHTSAATSSTASSDATAAAQSHPAKPSPAATGPGHLGHDEVALDVIAFEAYGFVDRMGKLKTMMHKHSDTRTAEASGAANAQELYEATLKKWWAPVVATDK
jgi:hypothetical protein